MSCTRSILRLPGKRSDELRQAWVEGRPVIAGRHHIGADDRKSVLAGRESAFRDGRELVVNQWDAYEIAGDISPEAALTALVDWMDSRRLTKLVTTTQLLITPGYRWKVAQGLITNFHQPESTLLLLVASLIGEDWRKVYDHALARGFRFLSYGDGCLLFAKSTH